MGGLRFPNGRLWRGYFGGSIMGPSGRISPSGLAPSNEHRWFLTWAKVGVLEGIMRSTGGWSRTRDAVASTNASLMEPSPRPTWKATVLTSTRVGKDVKVMILVDVKGFPVTARAASANQTECRPDSGTLWLHARKQTARAFHCGQGLRPRSIPKLPWLESK